MFYQPFELTHMSPFLQESLPWYSRDVFESGPDVMLTRALISDNGIQSGKGVPAEGVVVSKF